MLVFIGFETFRHVSCLDATEDICKVFKASCIVRRGKDVYMGQCCAHTLCFGAVVVGALKRIEPDHSKRASMDVVHSIAQNFYVTGVPSITEYNHGSVIIK